MFLPWSFQELAVTCFQGGASLGFFKSIREERDSSHPKKGLINWFLKLQVVFAQTNIIKMPQQLIIEILHYYYQLDSLFPRL